MDVLTNGKLSSDKDGLFRAVGNLNVHDVSSETQDSSPKRSYQAFRVIWVNGISRVGIPSAKHPVTYLGHLGSGGHKREFNSIARRVVRSPVFRRRDGNKNILSGQVRDTDRTGAHKPLRCNKRRVYLPVGINRPGAYPVDDHGTRQFFLICPVTQFVAITPSLNKVRNAVWIALATVDALAVTVAARLTRNALPETS